ncbi:MAG: Kelch repeat-containing protein [Planctomycetota bacterium]
MVLRTRPFRTAAVFVVIFAVAPLWNCSVAPPRAETLPIHATPMRRHGHRAHLLDDKIFVFGGFSSKSLTSDRGARETWIFDTKTGSWSPGPNLNDEHAFAPSAIVNNSIIAIGESIERYDATKGVWETFAAPGLTPRSHFSATALGTRIFTIGGFPQELGRFMCFDITTKKQIDVPPFPDAEPGDHFQIIATIGNAIHVVGGVRASVVDGIKKHWVFENNAWREAAPPPVEVWAKFGAHQAVGSKLFIFSNRSGLCFDAKTGAWTSVAPIPIEVCMPACFAAGEFIYVLGGLTQPNSNHIYIYDTQKDVWMRTQ